MTALQPIRFLRTATRVAIRTLLLAAMPWSMSLAAPITTCGVEHGTITGPPFLQTWTFTGTAGEHIILTATTTSGNLDTRLQLFPPSGPAEVESVCDFNGCRDQLDTVLLQSGTYTVLVSDNGLNDTGAYDLGLFRFSGPTTCLDDPDGGTLTCDQHLSGTIASPVDIDAFQFLGQAGDRVFIRAKTTAGSLDTRLSVYPPTGTVPEASSLCDFFGCRDDLEFQLAATGTYTVTIHPGSSAPGDYDVYFLALPCAALPGADPDTGSMACDQQRLGSISPAYEADRYTFNATAGERVFLTAQTMAGALDTYLAVYPPGGGSAEVGSLCDFFGCRDQIEFLPAVSGIYTVLVWDGSGASTGTYALTMFRLPCLNPSPAESDTGAFISDLTRHGSIGRLADYDPFRFHGEAGSRVLISAVREAGALDTRLMLFPPDGGPSEVQSLCDFFGCRDQLEVVLAQTGIYTLVVSDGSSFNRGTYQLTLSKLPGSATSIDDMDGGSIVGGETVSGRMQVSSDRDVWRFYGSAGQRAIVTALTTDGSLDTRIVLYPPGSGAAEGESLCDFFGCRDQLDIELAQTGLYTVVISDGSETSRGSYSLSLLTIPDIPAPGFYHLLPTDGQGVQPLQTLSFSWDPVPGATSYDVRLGSDPLAPVPLVAAGLTATGYTTPVLALDTEYFWRVDANTPSGVIRGPDRRFYAVDGTTDAPPHPLGRGTELELAAARPNPFREGTRLLLTIPRRSPGSVVVFDLHGRAVRKLHEGLFEPGVVAFNWDGRDDAGVRVRPGVYLCRAAVGDRARARKMCVLE